MLVTLGWSWSLIWKRRNLEHPEKGYHVCLERCLSTGGTVLIMTNRPFTVLRKRTMICFIDIFLYEWPEQTSKPLMKPVPKTVGRGSFCCYSRTHSAFEFCWWNVHILLWSLLTVWMPLSPWELAQLLVELTNKDVILSFISQDLVNSHKHSRLSMAIWLPNKACKCYLDTLEGVFKDTYQIRNKNLENLPGTRECFLESTQMEKRNKFPRLSMDSEPGFI